MKMIQWLLFNRIDRDSHQFAVIVRDQLSPVVSPGAADSDLSFGQTTEGRTERALDYMVVQYPRIFGRSDHNPNFGQK